MNLINESDRGEVIRILETGSVSDVMRRFSASRMCVHYHLKKMGLTTLKIKNDFRTLVLDKNPSLSNDQLARIFNINRDAVSAVRAKLDRSSFTHFKPDDNDKFLILELLKTLSVCTVAVKFDTSRPTLSRYLKDLGLSAAEIKHAHRIEVIKANFNKTNSALSKMLKCSSCTVYNLKNEIRLS